jgi:hypothetical protein
VDRFTHRTFVATDYGVALAFIPSVGILKKTLKSLFQFQQRAWTQEEWEITTVLQGLGPNDVEAEDGPE